MGLADVLLGLPWSAFGYGSYLIIFFASLVEALPAAGLFAPGMTVVIIGGVLVQLGVLDLWNIIFVASLGAILGDSISYIIGRRYGLAFMHRFGKYVWMKPERIDGVRELMRTHAGKALFIGRFHSWSRAFAPLIAGASHVSVTKFVVFTVPGCVIWAVVFVFIGMLFGQSYKLVLQYTSVLVAIIILAGIVSLLVYRRQWRQKTPDRKS